MKLIKDQYGKVVMDVTNRTLPPAVLFTGRHQAASCKVRWGPKCRSMKRKPEGRENVVLVCKTCGEYLEDKE